MIEEVKELPMIEALAELLMKNVDKIPLTDIYLAFPVLKSKDCPRFFSQLIKSYTISRRESIREFVNSAVYSAKALLLLGEDRQSSIVQDIVKWIKKNNV